MRWAIFENIMTPGGHEIEFDRLLVKELQGLGHEVFFCVPEDFVFSADYGVSVKRLGGKTVTYTGAKGLTKLLRSVKREWRRQGWYRELLSMAQAGDMDAVLVPTSTYRYLRALNRNPLKNSPVPIIFILHGINPGEAPKFFREAEKLLPCRNVRLAVLNFADDVLGRRLANVCPLRPPTYTPRDIDWSPEIEGRKRLKEFVAGEARELKLGFFGQYRREKRLEEFLRIFAKLNFTRPVKLLVQGSTMDPRDGEAFDKISREFSGDSRLEFWHRALVGAEWQQAIADADALLMPYSAPRYRYHWGGMLFTAIGSEKPTVASDDLNPEVWQSYKIGATFKSGDWNDLARCLTDFVNDFDANAATYAAELARAAKDFAPTNLARSLTKIAEDR
jgi:glycosyltransferase involved in cell wall biosynthesis